MNPIEVISNSSLLRSEFTQGITFGLINESLMVGIISDQAVISASE